MPTEATEHRSELLKLGNIFPSLSFLLILNEYVAFQASLFLNI